MGLNEQQIQLIETSFSALGGRGQLFIEKFYQRLFVASPEIEAMFSKTDWHQQRSQVMSVLIMIVNNLHDMKHIEAMLEKTIQTHKNHRIDAEYYRLMTDAILETFSEILGEKWSSEIELAWELALKEITRILQDEPI